MQKIISKPASTGALVAWACYDWAASSFATLIQTFVFASYFTEYVAINETIGGAEWGFVNSIAAIIVAITGPFLGAIADKKGHRKKWIAAYTFLCIVATALLWFIKPSPKYATAGLILVGLGIIGTESAAIFYNAMLPKLAPPERLGSWSGWGWGCGYVGGMASLILALVLLDHPINHWFLTHHNEAENVRIAFPLVAIWYFVFSLPLFLFTPDTNGSDISLRQAAIEGVVQLWQSVKNIRQYKNIIRYLIAHMFYTDALTTLFAFSGVYAATSFHMSTKEILLYGITLNITAGLGAALFSWLDDLIGSRKVIIYSIVGMTIPTAFILLTHDKTTFWLLGMVTAIFVGPAQASSRALMARLSPKDQQNEMFGFYALSGKSTAFVGPMIVGWMTFISASQRIGLSAVLFLFIIGGILMLMVKEPELSER